MTLIRYADANTGNDQTPASAVALETEGEVGQHGAPREMLSNGA